MHSCILGSVHLKPRVDSLWKHYTMKGNIMKIKQSSLESNLFFLIK